jgi:cyclophilin family peptidyl-prolyl cis-trans isomerase
MNRFHPVSRCLAAFLFTVGSALADNLPPELYAPLPANLTLQPGSAPITINLAQHLRDPDVTGTAVRISARIGSETRTIDLALFDTQAPATVANFLAYLSNGRYSANFFHRSVPGFIIQNGGFFFQNDTTFDYVPTYDPVVNEPGVSNLRGTIAMAKLGGDPDSATSQWFINLADNSANLDAQNGGFTVFGRVLGTGMAVADAIAAVPTYNGSSIASAWTDIPLANYAGSLARANFIETSLTVIPSLTTTVQSSAPDTVAASITNGIVTLTPSATTTGTATLTLTTTDLEGGQLVSTVAVTVPGIAQNINLTPPPGVTFGAGPFTPTAAASSGLPVSFEIVSGPATLDANGVLTVTGAGTVVLRAIQPGNAVYLAAATEQSFTVAPATASVVLGSLSQTYTGSPLAASATTTPAGLGVGFTYDGSATPPSLPGTYAVAAIVSDSNYNGSATGTLTIAKAPQTITFAAPSDRTYDGSTFTLSATAGSGLPVSFTVISGPASLDDQGLLAVTGVGPVTLRATQSGDANHLAATSVEHTFTVAPATASSLVLGNLAQTYDGTAHTPSVTTTPPGLAVTFAYGPAPGSPVAPVQVGSYAVTATLDDPRAANRPVATGTLVVVAAPLTARAPNLTRAVAQPNPALTVSYEGFVGTDTPASLISLPKLATKAVASSAPGVYPITITGGASPLYSLTLVPGTLTVISYGGTYEALLLDADDLPSGKITVTPSAKNLSFTGTLSLAGEAKIPPLKGTLTPSSDFASASASLLITVAGTAYDLAFTVSADGTLTGSLDRDSIPLADLALGSRTTPPAKGQTAPGAGANTLSLSPAYVLSGDDSAPLPGGAGYATAPIATSTGTLTLKGKTADGSPFTATLPPLAQNTYLLWANPYGTRTASFLAGPLILSSHPEQNRFPGRVVLGSQTGLLIWQKAALPETTAAAKRDKSHRAGFGPLGVPVAFDPWLPPSTKPTTKAPIIPAGTLAQRLLLASNSTGSGTVSVLHGPDSLDFGASGPALPFEATLDSKGTLVATAAAATSWSLKITPSTGVFTGSFTLRDLIPPATKPTARKVTFEGILRQPPSTESEPRLGAGRFLVPGFAKTDEQPSGELRLVAPARP